MAWKCSLKLVTTILNSLNSSIHNDEQYFTFRLYHQKSLNLIIRDNALAIDLTGIKGNHVEQRFEVFKDQSIH